MKFIATTFVLLFAGILALPQGEVGQDVETRLTVTNRIQRAVDEMNQKILERGLDPADVDDWFLNVNTPIGSANAHMEGLKCTGLAQNRFNQLSYNALLMRLTFDLQWPSIVCVIKSSGAEVTLFGRRMEALISGGLEMTGTSVGGSIRVRALPISGVSIRDCLLNIDTTIRSNLKVTWQGRVLPADAMLESLNKVIQDNKDALGRQMCEILGQVM